MKFDMIRSKSCTANEKPKKPKILTFEVFKRF